MEPRIREGLCDDGKSVFNYVAIGDLDPEEAAAFVEWLADRETPSVGMRAAYTWDYFNWTRSKRVPTKEPSRSINEFGIGYCGSCGRFTVLMNRDGLWRCPMCGYRNQTICAPSYGAKRRIC